MRWWWGPLCSRPTRCELDFYSACSLKQHSAGRRVASLGNIILIPSRPVFALPSYCCVLSGEASNTNFIVFGLTRLGLEPTIYRTQGEHANHYATDEPTIYRTQGEHANHYATDAVLENKWEYKVYHVTVWKSNDRCYTSFFFFMCRSLRYSENHFRQVCCYMYQSVQENSSPISEFRNLSSV